MKIKLILFSLILVLICSAFVLPRNNGNNILLFKMYNAVGRNYATTIQIKNINTGQSYSSSWIFFYKKFCILRNIPSGRYAVTKLTYMAGNYKSVVYFESPAIFIEVNGNSMQYFGSCIVTKEKIIPSSNWEEKENIKKLDNWFNNEFKKKKWSFDSATCYTPMTILQN